MNELRVIRWRGFVRVRSQRAAQERFRTISHLLSETAALQSIERYWKDSALYEINFTTLQEGETAADVVFNCLLNAQKLARGWNISGPSLYEAGIVTFEGLMTDANRSSSSQRNVDNLEWVSFSLRFDPSQDRVLDVSD